jgi:hypothetical protein
MHIQITTDHNMNGHESLATEVKASVRAALEHFSEHITRVDVHLSDQNSDKKGGNVKMRCLIKARLEGHKPVAVTHHETTLVNA